MFQRGKLGVIFHVVAVNDTVLALQALAETIQEKASRTVFRAVKQMMKVVIIVLSLNHRIGQIGVRTMQPANYLGIDGL